MGRACSNICVYTRRYIAHVYIYCIYGIRVEFVNIYLSIVIRLLLFGFDKTFLRSVARVFICQKNKKPETYIYALCIYKVPPFPINAPDAEKIIV